MTKTEKHIIQKLVVIKQLIKEKVSLLDSLSSKDTKRSLDIETDIDSLEKRYEALVDIMVTYKELQGQLAIYAKKYNVPFTESFITELIGQKDYE